MQHLNGKMMCAIDTETTGLDPRYNEIWQICILPLTDDLKPDKRHLPFYILIKPEHPNYIDWNVPVFKKNRAKIMEALQRGIEQETAVDLLIQWIERSTAVSCSIPRCSASMILALFFLNTGDRKSVV